MWRGVLILALTSACAARSRVDGEMLRRVRFEGNPANPLGAASDDALRRHITQRQSPPGSQVFPLSALVRPEALQPDRLERDARSIEVYLAHQGWFDARLTGWRIVSRRPERRRKAAVVDLVGVVELGPRTHLDADSPVLRYTETHPEAPELDTLRREAAWVKPNHPPHTEGLLAAGRSVAHFLHRHGFAYAQVAPSLEVWADEHRAHAELLIRPGPAAVIGPITLEGLERVHPGVVRDLLERVLREGQPYDVERLAAAQQALFELGVFALVEVTPDLSDPQVQAVPIHVHLVEAPPRTLEVGAGLSWEGPLLVPQGRASWSHRDVFGELWQVQAAAHGGVAINPSDARLSPLAGLDLGWQVPELGARWLELHAHADTTYDLVEAQLQRWHTGFRPTLDFLLGRRLVFEVDPALRWTQIEDPTTANGERLQEVLFGRDGQGYVATPLDLSLRYVDRAGAELDSHRGLWLEGTVGRAFPWLSPVGWELARAEARVHFTPRDVHGIEAPWGLGGRLRLEAQRPLPGSELPWPERYFLGGSADFRGFRVGQVGVYDCVCVLRNPAQPEVSDEQDIGRRYLPRGGTHAALASGEVELREVLVPELSLATFAEAGSLTERLVDLPLALRWAVGGGIRYRTPLGPLRLDLTARPLYPEDRGPVFGPAGEARGAYLGCDEVGPRRRAFDLLSELDRRQPWDRTFPAINLFLGVGEAF